MLPVLLLHLTSFLADNVKDKQSNTGKATSQGQKGEKTSMRALMTLKAVEITGLMMDWIYLYANAVMKTPKKGRV